MTCAQFKHDDREEQFMDVLTAGFYAAVCGVLAAFAPQGSARWVRGLIGMAVGIVAAGAWPVLHGMLLR